MIGLPTSSPEVVSPARETRPNWLSRAVNAVRKRPSAAVGLFVIAAFVVLAVFAPWISPYSTSSPTGPIYAAPSASHWLGTNSLGIDELSLLIVGSRISLLVGSCAAVVAGLIGGTVGLVSGYFGGAVDVVLMRTTDFFIVIPPIPLMIVIAAVWGPSLGHIILVIGLLLWATTARVIRAQTKSVRQRGFVKRAETLGERSARTIVRHVLPQVAPLLLANVILTVALSIFYETALDFLGIGDPTAVSWGTIIQNAFLETATSNGAWWAIVPAGLAIALVIISCYLVGQALEDALNPRLSGGYLLVRPWKLRPLTGREAEDL